MKRDFDLIRSMLIEIEPTIKVTAMQPFDGHHFRIMQEAGYIDMNVTGEYAYITWQGMEVLDTIRNDDAWRKAKAIVEKSGLASVSFAMFLKVVESQLDI